MHHNISITYQPKKDRVFQGTCRQTLRLHSKVRRGDSLTLFEWKGKPRHSKWGRRLDAECRVSVPVEVSAEGILFPDYLMLIDMVLVEGAGYSPSLGSPFMAPPFIQGMLVPWRKRMADWLAAQDGIDPPTGIEWFEVLKKLHPKADWRRGEEGRLIRW